MCSIPLTRIKIHIAKLLYKLVKLFGQPDVQIIRRKNISYEVDLSEGIDLAIFLFGEFQSHLFKQSDMKIAQNAIIFDVGANIGDTTLKFANQFPESQVFAFEPTDFAWKKLLRNIELNPDLSTSITPVKCFLSDTNCEKAEMIAYASWKLVHNSEKSHHYHGGLASSAVATPSIRLDTFIEENRISRVDLLKIDTDGHEVSVLRGAIQTLQNFKPYLIIEVGQYTLHEENSSFIDIWNILKECGYSRIINSQNGKEINLQNYKNIIPEKATIDIVAYPG
jgi:FkbM family methyltransferase